MRKLRPARVVTTAALSDLAWQDVARQQLNAASQRLSALLARHGYRPTVAHCGGQGHRKLFFDLWTGHVWLAHRPPGEAA